MKNSLAIILILFFCSVVATAEGESQPNVIIINVDNHHKGSLGYYGNPFIETPNIDRLFNEGLRFENYHIAGRCTSSRSALLTGRYHARNGGIGTGAAWEATKEGVTTVAHLFSEAKYRTAMFGKWHMGDTYPLRPEDRGFDEVVTIHNGGSLASVVLKKGYNSSSRTGEAFRFRHNGEWKPYEGFRTDIWFNELNRYLNETRRDKRPFFVYLATVTAHGPHYGPKDLRDKYLKKYELPQWKKLREKDEAKKSESKAYDHAADIASLDRNVGRLLATLEKLDLLDKTILIYMSDGSGGGKATVGKDKMPKGSLLSNVPCVFRWKGLSHGSNEKLVANIDLLPTLTELCDVPLTPELRDDLDGQSFASMLDKEGASPWRPRAYIVDHQSSGGKEDLRPLKEGAHQMMLLRPYASSQVHLPSGEEVGWKGQKLASKGASQEAVKKAEAAYEKWLQHVIQDFPLGAFGQVGEKNGLVFLEGYPISEGPAGPGIKTYFLLDVSTDGEYLLSAQKGDRHGGKKDEEKTVVPVTLSLSVQTKPGDLPVGFDKKLNGYRVLPTTLRAYFKTTRIETPFPLKQKLKKGRYLICVERNSVKPQQMLRVERK